MGRKRSSDWRSICIADDVTFVVGDTFCPAGVDGGSTPALSALSALPSMLPPLCASERTRAASGGISTSPSAGAAGAGASAGAAAGAAGAAAAKP